MNQNELYHFGIKGMRWGVRRYQNADGSLTAAGKKKYGTKTNFEKVKSAKLKAQGKDPKSIREKERAKANARTQKEIDKYTKKKKNKDADIDEEKKTKSIKDMSDDELREKVNRMQLERNAYDLNRQLSSLNPKQVSKGKQLATEVFNDVVKPAAKNAGKTYLERTLNDLLGNNSKDSISVLKKEVETLELKKRRKDAQDYLNGKKDNNDELRKRVESKRLKKEEGDLDDYERNREANAKSAEWQRKSRDSSAAKNYYNNEKWFYEQYSKQQKNQSDNTSRTYNNAVTPTDTLALEYKNKKKKRLKHGGVDMNQNELYHYGVVGMKWGVHRSASKQKAISRLERKAFNYDKKSANFTKKSEKQHAKHDLERSNRNAIKAAKLSKKAAKVNKKALKTDNDFRKVMLQKKAAKLNYKSEKAEIKGNRISKTTGYGMEAMKYAIKSDKMAAKAAKARMKIAKNKAYIEMTKRKVNSLSGEDLQKGKEYIAKLNIE